MIESIQGQRRAAKTSAERIANASETAVAQAVDDVEEHIHTISGNVETRYDDVSSRVHGLTAQMQDLAANESQWREA